MIFLNFCKSLLLLISLSLFFGFSLPTYAETAEETDPKPKTKKQKKEEFFDNLELFTHIFNRVQGIYVEEVDSKTLFENAIKGMVSELDPHSDFLKPAEQKKLIESTSGKFGGLGIVINMKDKLIEVISPIDDTPAYRAGIQAGDLIVKIGDKSVRGLTLDQGVDLMRGKPKTSIKLTIARKDAKPFVVDIVREIITIITVKGYLLEENIGYIRISSFQEPTIGLLKTTINELVAENKNPLNSLVLDLRNNPGGILDGAVDVSNLFIDKKGLIVYTKGRARNSTIKYHTKPGDILHGAPMVVLINEGSASASEIVSGALQDHKRAIIIGNTSFGKASVQTLINLPKGYGVKITTARYYTPSGRSIQAKGIEPDVILKNINLEEAEEEVEISAIKEKDLQGHLTTEDPNNLSKKEILAEQKTLKEKQDEASIERLKQDYFVLSAVNILKALTVLSP